MKTDIFSGLKFDALDAVSYDVMDQVELDPEDKILYSDDLRKLLQEEIAKKIADLPLGKMIFSEISRQVADQLQAKSYDTKISNAQEMIETKLKKQVKETKAEFKNELEKVTKELRAKYAEYRNILNSSPRYEFGGFAPPNPLNSAVGTFLQNTDQTWSGISWAAASTGSDGTITLGDGTTDGSWRFRISGTDLLHERLESGIWTEKGRDLA